MCQGRPRKQFSPLWKSCEASMPVYVRKDPDHAVLTSEEIL